MTMNSIMKNLFGEYGLIIILIVVAMVGYLVVRGNEEDILARSLDGIRDRLVVGGRRGPAGGHPPRRKGVRNKWDHLPTRPASQKFNTRR